MHASDAQSPPSDAWDEIAGQIRGQTVLVLGAPGAGKTMLTGYLAQRLARGRHTVGLVSSDPGQPSVGVPTCLGLSLGRPFTQARALWFVGDTTPVGAFLPTVVGTARLAALARAEGAKTVLIDTSGLIAHGFGRVLKYHKAVAAAVDQVLAVQQNDELESILTVLEPVVSAVWRLPPAAQARNRSVSERRAFRQTAYQRHFERARSIPFAPRLLVDRRWSPLRIESLKPPMINRIIGLNDRRGICLGLGILEAADADHLQIYTACPDIASVTWLQLGRLALERQAGFAESR